MLIDEDYGITTINGLWVCNNDSCRTLDENNNAIEKPWELDEGEENRLTKKRHELADDIAQMRQTLSSKQLYNTTCLAEELVTADYIQTWALFYGAVENNDKST